MPRVNIQNTRVEIEAGSISEIEAITTLLTNVLRLLEFSQQSISRMTEPALEQRSDTIQSQVPLMTYRPIGASDDYPNADAIVQTLREIGRPAAAPEIYQAMIERGRLRPNERGSTANLRIVMNADPRIGKASEKRNAPWTLVEWLPQLNASPQQELYSEESHELKEPQDVDESEVLDEAHELQESQNTYAFGIGD